MTSLPTCRTGRRSTGPDNVDAAIAAIRTGAGRYHRRDSRHRHHRQHDGRAVRRPGGQEERPHDRFYPQLGQLAQCDDHRRLYRRVRRRQLQQDLHRAGHHQQQGQPLPRGRRLGLADGRGRGDEPARGRAALRGQQQRRDREPDQRRAELISASRWWGAPPRRARQPPDESGPGSAKGLGAAIAAQRRNERALLNVPGAIGHAVGAGNSPVVKILVREITPARPARRAAPGGRHPGRPRRSRRRPGHAILFEEATLRGVNSQFPRPTPINAQLPSCDPVDWNLGVAELLGVGVVELGVVYLLP